MKVAVEQDHLDQLENQSVYILREAYANFKNLAMLWSIGKDSTVLLWLARKAFFGHVPITLVHIDTSFKIPAMITYRDELARQWGLNMVYGQNKEALAKGETFPAGKLTRLQCCKALKTDALRNTLSGEWPRFRMNHKTGQYEVDSNREPYTGVIVGARADEERAQPGARDILQFAAIDHHGLGRGAAAGDRVGERKLLTGVRAERAAGRTERDAAIAIDGRVRQRAQRAAVERQ
mgnify:CR=1 FL=1